MLLVKVTQRQFTPGTCIYCVSVSNILYLTSYLPQACVCFSSTYIYLHVHVHCIYLYMHVTCRCHLSCLGTEHSSREQSVVGSNPSKKLSRVSLDCVVLCCFCLLVHVYLCVQVYTV